MVIAGNQAFPECLISEKNDKKVDGYMRNLCVMRTVKLNEPNKYELMKLINYKMTAKTYNSYK